MTKRTPNPKDNQLHKIAFRFGVRPDIEPAFNKAIQDYTDQQTKAARINELERLKKIDAFNEAYSSDPRCSRFVNIRLDQLRSSADE